MDTIHDTHLLTVREIAMRVGVTDRTVRLWIKRGLPAVRIGHRSMRVTEADLGAWLAYLHVSSTKAR